MVAALWLAMADVAAMSGFYVSHQMEVGAALQLHDDGSFEYQLDYGAVSESAEGEWSIQGDTIYLTARRMTGAFKSPIFDRQPMKIEAGRILLNRYDTVVRFVREDLPVPADKKSGELQNGDRGRTDEQH